MINFDYPDFNIESIKTLKTGFAFAIMGADDLLQFKKILKKIK